MANSVTKLPKSTRTRNVFLIDLKKFNIKDVLADDNGSYKKYGNKLKIFSVVKENNLNVIVEKVNKYDCENNSIFSAYKIFYKSKTEAEFFRKTIRIKSLNDDHFDKLVLIYHHSESCNVNFQSKPHGNSTKVFRPFIRTSQSRLDDIKKN